MYQAGLELMLRLTGDKEEQEIIGMYHSRPETPLFSLEIFEK